MTEAAITSQTKPRAVLVAGDVVIDWNFAHTTSSADDGTTWDPNASTCAGAQPGGAALLGSVLEAAGKDLLAEDGRPWEVHPPTLPDAGVCPGDRRHHHSFAIWTPMKRGDRAGGWRVARFLGLQRRQAPAEALPSRRAEIAPELLVLDDGALTFRDDRAEWPREIVSGEAAPWIVLKMASPVAAGLLWNEALRDRVDRTIVVVPVDDLRRTEVQIRAVCVSVQSTGRGVA